MALQNRFGYLGLCFLIAIYFFSNAKKLGNYGPPKDEPQVASSKPEYFGDTENDKSQYSQHARALASSSDSTNTTTSSDSTSGQSLTENNNSTSGNNAYFETTSPHHAINNQSLAENKEHNMALNASGTISEMSLLYHAISQSFVETKDQITALNASEETSLRHDAINQSLAENQEDATSLNASKPISETTLSYDANNQSLAENKEQNTALNSSETISETTLLHHTTKNNHSLADNKEQNTALNASDKRPAMTLLRHTTKNQSQSENNIYYVNGTAVVNPWYGWQPRIHPMDCSWERCMMKNHGCKFCRDALEDMNVTNSSSLDPGEDWIPDVTMLRRMYLEGHDANGNPWPPPLDDGLCHALRNDTTKTKELLDMIPIVGAPMLRTPEMKKNRVLCGIYAMEKQHATRIRAMRETWAPGCDGFLIFSTKSDPRIPAISIPHIGPEHYRNMWQKLRSITQFVGKHYMDQFDWFYFGGDDMLPFPQNLKNYLATFNSSEPQFIGRRFKGKNRKAFNTGGPGYALSRPALRCLLKHREDDVCMPRKVTSQEDVVTALCLEKACDIKYTDTRDEQKRERFHHFDPHFMYTYKGRMYWYERFNKEWGGNLLGKNCCSPETVAFHTIKQPAMVRYIQHYVHNCKDARNL